MIPKKQLLSVIIIARNEEARIAECLEKVAWADEKIVIDNGSIDDTVAIAKKHGAAVIEEKIKDFSEIRNIGARHAHGDWLLYVDADEIVTPSLKSEIIEVIRGGSTHVAFFIPRQNYYLGHLWPTTDGMVRLIAKKSLIKWVGVLHEHVQIKGETGKLKNHFIHNTHRSIAEMVAKTNEWSFFEAKLRFDHHHPPISWWRLLRVMITAFINSYITQGGWKVGAVGLIESTYQAFSMFVTYAKLWEMQKKNI